MSDYPAYFDGKPQTITLKEYDLASWAKTTCVDHRDNEYVVVLMEKPEEVIVKIDPKDNEILDKVFKSAHQSYSEQLANKN